MPKEKEFRVDIDLGRKDTTVYEYAFIGLILDILMALMLRFGVSSRNAMRVIDNINRKFFPGGKVNDYIIRDEEWLDVRVEGDVTDAVEEYKKSTDWEPVTGPEAVVIESAPDDSAAQALLGGELRATYDFVLNQEQQSNGNSN